MGVLHGDLRREGDAVAGLRYGLQGSVLDAVHGRGQQPGAGEGEPGQQVAAGVTGPDHLGHRAVDGAGVEALLDEEGGGPGDLVARHDRVLNGRGATPGGQQREVQVDPAVDGDVEGDAGQQGPVRDHGTAVGPDLPEPREELLVPGLGGLQHLDPGLLGPLGHGTGDQPASPPGGRVGPRDDGDHFMPFRPDQGIQSGNGDLRGTSEDKPHGWAGASRTGFCGQRTSL